MTAPRWGGTLNSGGPDDGPGHGATRAVDGPAQRKEAGSVSVRESDPPIVVGCGAGSCAPGQGAEPNGRAGHKAKGRAREQRKQSTYRGTRILPTNGVKLPACNGDGPWHLVPDALTECAFPEEPGAGNPHAGICEGGAGQPASLPQSARK